MITDRAILDAYYKFQSTYWHHNREARRAELPEELRMVLDANDKLQPGKCSPSVIRDLYIERLKAIEPCFTVDEFCSPAIDLISQRIAKSGEFETLSPSYGLSKGIILLGGIGSGKTLLMHGLTEVCRFFEIVLHIVPTYTITEDFSKNGYQVFNTFYYKAKDLKLTRDMIILDDMGAEAVSTHYGQVTNVIAELLLRRYDEAGITFGTSNLDQKTLRKFYGDRVWSRMKSMFNFIELKGDDRRK